jgi:hypothetical protein
VAATGAGEGGEGGRWIGSETGTGVSAGGSVTGAEGSSTGGGGGAGDAEDMDTMGTGALGTSWRMSVDVVVTTGAGSWAGGGTICWATGSASPSSPSTVSSLRKRKMSLRTK